MTTRWNTPPQDGRIAVVTGATSGLGLEVTRALAGAGARVILAVRDTDRGGAVRDSLPGRGHQARRLDLSDLDSVRAFAAAVDEPIDVLVNNAGVMAIPYARSAQGHEMQFAVNHLGHFALTLLLMPRLEAAPAARVVPVTSVLAKKGRLEEGPRYDPKAAYNRSKLANAVFGIELHRRLTAAGSPVTSVPAHPGYSRTNLQSNGPTGLHRFLLEKIGNPLLAQDAAKGALPLLYAATDPAVRGGQLIGPDGPGELRGQPAVVEPAPAALDPAAGRRLWELSEELTGVSFTIA
ncbi:oxidoreductase [Actinoplanes sp. CA-030573]|uniref:oxidoreductase n=1 Tax=Actinoplanes sp. CA-030573 TaxID=3239898 RepID=UPI003D94F9EF